MGAPVAEGAYWRLESLLKLYESRRGCVMGANGAIYAVRRHLFPPFPAGTVVDDFVAALRVLQNGYEVKYEPEAIAHEESAPGGAAEYKRRVRIAAGCFRALWQHRGLLGPAHGFVPIALLLRNQFRLKNSRIGHPGSQPSWKTDTFVSMTLRN